MRRRPAAEKQAAALANAAGAPTVDQRRQIGLGRSQGIEPYTLRAGGPRTRPSCLLLYSCVSTQARGARRFGYSAKESRGIERRHAGALCVARAQGRRPPRPGECARHQQCRCARAEPPVSRQEQSNGCVVVSVDASPRGDPRTSQELAGDVAISADIALRKFAPPRASRCPGNQDSGAARNSSSGGL